jgi:hypothetical protein
VRVRLLERRRLILHGSQGFSSLNYAGLGEESYFQILLVVFILLALTSTFLFLQNAKGREMITVIARAAGCNADHRVNTMCN